MNVIDAGTDAEIDSVFADLAVSKSAAMIGTDTFYFAQGAHMVAAAARERGSRDLSRMPA